MGCALRVCCNFLGVWHLESSLPFSRLFCRTICGKASDYWISSRLETLLTSLARCDVPRGEAYEDIFELVPDGSNGGWQAAKPEHWEFLFLNVQKIGP